MEPYDDGACTRCDGHGKEWDWSDDFGKVDLKEDCRLCGGSGYEPTGLKSTPDPDPILSGWNDDPLEVT